MVIEINKYNAWNRIWKEFQKFYNFKIQEYKKDYLLGKIKWDSRPPLKRSEILKIDQSKNKITL